MDIIGILIKRIVLIIICTVIGLSSAYISNKYMKDPTYTATVQLYVRPYDSSSYSNLNDLNYAQKVINTYVYLLKTKVFFQEVLNDCDLNYSPEQLSAMTTIAPISNTELFQISVTSLSAEDSYRLVESMQVLAPAMIKSISDTAEISVIDPVVKPFGPSGSNVFLNTLIGGIMGFLFSALAVLLWEIINVNVKNKEDLNKRYQIPILGVIPNYSLYNFRWPSFLNVLPAIRKQNLKRSNIVRMSDETKFEVSEAFKELRTNLRFAILKNDCKKLVINSPVPKDGKSSTSTNLAITIAQTGAKVLLMDCDLRKGRIHNYFNLKSKPGVSDVLSGMINEKDVIYATNYENLQVMTMGSIPPNPTELLGSMQMEELMKRLEKNYEYIIIDSPPVNIVSDALSLVRISNGVVIVVREGVTSHPNISNALSKYKLAKANILGFVLNGVSTNQGHGPKSHYHYYNKK